MEKRWAERQTRIAALREIVSAPIDSIVGGKVINQGMKDWARADLENLLRPARAWILASDDVKTSGSEVRTMLPLKGSLSRPNSVERLVGEMMEPEKALSAIYPFPDGMESVALVHHGGLDMEYFNFSMSTDQMESFLLKGFLTKEKISHEGKQAVRVEVANLREICAGFVDFNPGTEGTKLAFDLTERWNPELFKRMTQLRPEVAMSSVFAPTLESLLDSLKNHREAKWPDCDLILQQGEFAIARKSTNKEARVTVVLATFHQKLRDRPTVIFIDNLTLLPN